MNGSAQEQQLDQIETELIVESTTNPRKSFADMEGLKASIAESGIRVPLLVRPRMPDSGAPGVYSATEAQYELVCGARRLRAARALDLEEVPCLVREMDDAEARDVQVIENLQRAEVHPVEEAEAYAAMIETAAGWTKPNEPARVSVTLTAEDIAKKVGKPAAYVAQRLKLLTLGIDAKLLFSRNHLTLGHALLLARLTEADQGRALLWMLDADPKYVKQTLTEVIRSRLGRDGSAAAPEQGVCRYCGCAAAKACPGGCAWVDAEETVCSGELCVCSYEMDREMEAAPRSVPNVAKHMREGGRLIDATEAQLKRWIEANVLLKLADVPWRLGDAELLPAAGSCGLCPKRSGSNAALFGDLTAAEDVCLDPACFAQKQDALVGLHKREARKAGADVLLKISAKRSIAKLDGPAVQRVQSTAGGVKIPGAFKLNVLAKGAVRAGQWVAADAGSCPLTVQGLLVDGPDKGRLLSVCADQGCKAHTHEIERPRSANRGGNGESWEQQRKVRDEKARAYVAAETPLRLAVYAAIKRKAKPDMESMLRQMIPTLLPGMDVCVVAGIAVAEPEEEWQADGLAAQAVQSELKGRSGAQLIELAFDALHAGDVVPNSYGFEGPKQDREALWELAKEYGVDAEAVLRGLKAGAKATRIPSGNDKQREKAAAKAPVKKTAAKVAKKAAKKAAAKKKGKR